MWHLALAGFVLLAVSLPWAIAVDLTPPAQRPYVRSSSSNSELHLVFGYNGIHRLFSSPPVPRPVPPRTLPSRLPVKVVGMPSLYAFKGGEDGFPGPMRLFNNQLAGQISWLLPLTHHFW
jgi:4-amino-4-deoxy-L-arabinose transferase-like glycosyltransferase